MEDDINEAIGEVCHEVNRALCEAGGDMSQPAWKDATPGHRKSTADGVQWRIDNPSDPVSAQHDQWCDAKRGDGWVYGPDKDVEFKTHPCLRPFDELSDIDRAKDHVFVAIVKTMSKYAAAGDFLRGDDQS